jgi:DNA-binding GntR family transcriptional regulator
MNQQQLIPISHTSLRSRVYETLRQAIVHGQLSPGQRVRDQDLAHQLGVSRTPVREALQRLEDEGLVEARRGSLTRIMPLDTAAAYDAFPVVASLHALATRLAMPHLSPTDLEALHQANQTLALALAAHEVFQAIAADDRFHQHFVQCSQNTELALTLERLMPKIRRLEIAQFASLAGRRSVEQHEAIIEACKHQQSTLAADLVEQNWLSLGQQISTSLPSGSTG